MVVVVVEVVEVVVVAGVAATTVIDPDAIGAVQGTVAPVAGSAARHAVTPITEPVGSIPGTVNHPTRRPSATAQSANVTAPTTRSQRPETFGSESCAVVPTVAPAIPLGGWKDSMAGGPGVVVVVVVGAVVVAGDDELVSGAVEVVVCAALGPTPSARSGTRTSTATSAADDVRRRWRWRNLAAECCCRRMQDTSNTFHVPRDDVVVRHMRDAGAPPHSV